MGNLSSCIKVPPEDQWKVDSKEWANEDPFSVTKVTPRNTINVRAYLASPGWTGASVVPEFITGQMLKTP
ncbi:RFPL3S isoform 2 [Pongo abelii]|uniref:RFPL3S isoform 2 n=1 Tax=Pongo abelii TaxID=9601 RepID=A0A2J8UVL5_PONAB|nr:RFPL3S isoform 2 [Pongo abelii]